MERTIHADFRKLAELIRDIRVAIMLTFPGNAMGQTGPGFAAAGVRARPMYTQKLNPDIFEGELWFFSDADTGKIDELNRDASVMLAYAAPDKNRFIVVRGTASAEHNPQKAQELWNIHAKGWWPEGPTSPSLALIRVRVHSAEYWDGPSNASYMLSLLKAVATGERVNVQAEHGVV